MIRTKSNDSRSKKTFLRRDLGDSHTRPIYNDPYNEYYREQAFSGVAERVITALFLPACPQTRISKQLGDQNSESVIERRAEMAVIRDLDLFQRVDSLLYAHGAFNEIKNGIFGKIARTRYVCTCIIHEGIRTFVERVKLNNVQGVTLAGYYYWIDY